jgi:predicted nicotinamide N-methyase
MEELVSQLRKVYFLWGSYQSVEDVTRDFLTKGAQCEAFQGRIVQELLNSERAIRFPVHGAHRQRFVKRLILALEESGVEVVEPLYEAVLLGRTEPESDAYKTYFLSDDVVVSLAERCELVADGTTGLRTWQAAEYLTRWMLKKKKSQVTDRTVLELGSGLGYVGISLLKLELAARVWMTDSHPKVLDALRQNCAANGIDDPDVAELDWDKYNRDLIERCRPDLVVASDVVFDPALLPGLARTVRTCLEISATEVVVACTVRVEETIQWFVAELRERSLSVVDQTDQDLLTGAEDRILLFSVTLQSIE